MVVKLMIKRIVSILLSLLLFISFGFSYTYAVDNTVSNQSDQNISTNVSSDTVADEVYNLPEKYFKDGDIIVPIDDVNKDRLDGEAIAYTSSYGKSTNTNQWGMEITVVNNVVKKVTKPNYVNPNNSAVPDNGVVISIHISNPEFNVLLNRVKEGDKVEVVLDNFNTTTFWKTKYDAFDPKTYEDNPAGYGVPGMRGNNQLIIYDSLYGSRTGTNEYGYEVVINKDGEIVSAGGNNSEIPTGGLVLSGHGDAAKWLKKYALIGSTVAIDKINKEVIIKHMPMSYVDEAQYKIDMVENNLKDAKEQFKNIPYDDIQAIIDSAKGKLDNAKTCLNKGSYEEAENLLKSIDDDVNKAMYMSFESVKVESRAIWIRPKEKSLSEVEKNLDMLENMNINTIYLDVFWGGYTIYPTSNKYTAQNPIYNGFDVLDAYVKEAHKRGMEVYAWTENFLIGTSNLSDGGPIKAKEPNWLMISRKGYNYLVDSSGIKYYFLNPVIPDAREFLIELYKELAIKYDIDGIQFDYMRYPNSYDYSNDFGYDDYTRNLFKQYAGVDPKYLNVSSDMWQLWNYFRMNIINSFAYSVISELRMIKPEIKIAADVWPNYDTAPSDIFQDSKDWTIKNYLDILNPMSYYTSVLLVTDDLKNTLNFASGHSMVVPAIGTSIGTDSVTLLKQIDAIRNNGGVGVGLFEFESLFKNGYEDALKGGVFSTQAVAPDKDPIYAVETVLGGTLSDIDGVYVKLGGMSQSEASTYKNLLSSIISALKSPNAVGNLKATLNEIDDVLQRVNNDKNLNTNVVARITNDLTKCKMILSSIMAGEEFKENHVIDELRVEIPSNYNKIGSVLPVKVKGIFGDNKLDFVYLDTSQYEVVSDNPSVVGVSNGSLIINGTGKANIKITVKGNLNIAHGVDTKLSFTVDTNSADKKVSLLNGVLKAVNISNNSVELSWSDGGVDLNAAGYIVERNGEEIARVNNTSYKDMTCTPGESYTYKIEAFDTSGGILDTSNMISVTTKSNDSKNNYIYLSGTASAYGNIALYRVDEAKSLDVIKNAESDVVINFNSNENTRLKEIIIPVSVINELKMAQRNLVINTDDLKITILKDLLNIDNVNGYISIKITNKGTSQKINNLTPISNIYDIEVTKNGQKVSIPMSVALVTNGTT
ncbi:family 10 glycosylhydrolase [Thermoanaerobacterium thermosaccharolyticum]|uniref:glycoside hydrolase family 10 protein n=1 Tax=Thermoanaerobacterium thermosaccharolyticum TaxID=1517 RepID=UPI003DA85267